MSSKSFISCILNNGKVRTIKPKGANDPLYIKICYDKNGSHASSPKQNLKGRLTKSPKKSLKKSPKKNSKKSPKKSPKKINKHQQFIKKYFKANAGKYSPTNMMKKANIEWNKI